MKQVENIYKCLPFWSWNDKLDKNELIKQVEWMHKNGVGGFFMHARGGLKTEYLGEEWFECIDACLEKARQLNMQAYAYDENGWPSGFVGGKLLEDKNNLDQYLTCSIGKYDKNSLVSYDISGEELKRVKDGENVLNIFLNYSTSTVDILDTNVVDKFIKLTHEEYKKRDISKALKGFFTDEPQYFRWGQPYTKVIAKYYLEKYNEDILDGLGFLFIEKKGYQKFRYRFWKAMQSLMLKNFAERLYNWCDENDYKLTGHFVEESLMAFQMWCCGGVMPFYEFEHIPGIDWLGRDPSETIAPKQVSSVAAQLGKKQVLTETFGCCGWDVTPIELKKIAEIQYVNGVNLMCQHLLPYSEHGQRKRDFPVHFSEINPWVKKGFKQFNDYFSVLGNILSESTEIVKVGIIHPITSIYMNYRADLVESSYNVGDFDKAFAALSSKLSMDNIPYHYLDEVILEKYGKVSGNILNVGLMNYEYIIFPKILNLDENTSNILKDFIKNGGKVLITDKIPTYLNGEEFVYDFLKSTTTYEEIKKSQNYIIDNSQIRSTCRIDTLGNKFIYALNTGEATHVKIDAKCRSFSEYDILKDLYISVSKDLLFEKDESKILYFSDKEYIENNKKLNDIVLGKSFDIIKSDANSFTLDFVRFSIDGKEYSEKLHHLGVFDELLKIRHKGKLYLKYEFNIKNMPLDIRCCYESQNIVAIKVNNIIIKETYKSDLDIGVREFNLIDHVVVGNNTVILEQDYYQNDYVYYALYGENVTESVKNCLVYDSNVEAIFIKGNFGVFGNFKNGKTDQIYLGESFYIDKPPKSINCLIKQGYPFFSGNITLKQNIFVDNTDCQLVFDNRFHLIEVILNRKNLGTLIFGNKMDLSNHLKIGENEIVIVLTVGNRNLLGPFHTPIQEDDFVCPITFERTNQWENGKCLILRESYSFIKTII